MISWRIQETARERRPFPKASKHPARTVPSVETRKPRLVMRSMGTPTAMSTVRIKQAHDLRGKKPG